MGISSTSNKVSVIIPLYNQERYLNACLQSVCNQSYQNLEIIVVNDGSTNDSPKFARKWAEKDGRIRVIDKPNEGVTWARRDGLTQATGEYVAFLDSDDLLPCCAIETLVRCMDGTDVDLAVGSVAKKLGFVKLEHVDKMYSFPVHQVVSQPELFDKYFVGFYLNTVFPVSMWGRLYRKSAIDRAITETDLFDKEVDRMGEDQYFNLKLFPYLRSMYRTDETVYIYRYGGGTTRFNPYFTQLFASSDKRLKLLDKYNYTQGYEPLFDEYIACLYFYASQLIFDKRADKDGVIDFIKQEMEHREIVPRLINHFSRISDVKKPVHLFLDRDYEGIYQYASEQGNKMFGSVSFRLKSELVKMIDCLFLLPSKKLSVSL